MRQGEYDVGNEPGVRARAGALGLVAMLVIAAGCDRRVEPYVPIEHEPPAPERPVRIPGLEKTRPRTESRPLIAAGPGIRGQVALADGASSAGSGVLFVIARSGGGGPPLAVKRLPAGPFPLAFEIGPADVMVPGREFAGPVALSARLDRDGDPLTRGPDDLAGATDGSVATGSAGISIVLRPD